MCGVLSLHNSTEFGCFSSISDKIINNLPWWGVFQANFWWPLVAKLLMGPKKKFRGKMMAQTTSIILQNLVEIERRMSAWEHRVWFFPFFVNNAPQITVACELVALLQQEIALIYVGWFRCGLQRFYWEEKPFPVNQTDLKIVVRWRYDTCRNARENFQNLRKWVQSLCIPLRPFRSELKEKFYHSLLPHVL